jgi:c-di-GMP-binding flagellar brake protein YcgR
MPGTVRVLRASGAQARPAAPMPMNETAPPPLQDEPERLYEKYMLHQPTEIRTRLQQLIDRRCTLHIHAAEPEDVVTSALALGENCLWIDAPHDAAASERLQSAERLQFGSSIDRIDVRFSTGPARPGVVDGLPALEVELPRKLIHLQRRDYVRREPVTELACTLRIADETGSARTVAAKIADISGGGLAVLSSDEAMPQPEVGDVMPDVVLTLPDNAPLTVRLRVQHVVEFEQRGRQVWRAGCQFVELSTRDEERLLRYVMHLDRLHAAKRRGRDV